MSKIAVIGGGVAGSTAALSIANSGLDVTLFEQKNRLISGPPFCHLHAGGNLYREIDDNQCRELLRQSIEFAKLYPFCVDKRATIITIPTNDPDNPKRLLDRLNMLRDEYASLVAKDDSNKVLGEVDNYFEVFECSEVEKLSKLEPNKNPKSAKDWVVAASKIIDKDAIKYPLIVVNEYGLNMFRLSSAMKEILNSYQNIKLHLDTKIESISKNGSGFIVRYGNKEEYFDYIINAAGFRTGEIDDMLGIKANRLVEFKAAYTAKWEDRGISNDIKLPEIIFHGQRGTPQGMAQFTPYCGGYIQLHGMRKDITLFEDGLASSQKDSSMPKLPKKFIDMIDKGWQQKDIEIRTKRAIEYMSNFIPSFKSAKVGGKPLFGAQQIPGDDITLRVAEASFPLNRYARCEIVKVSSVTDMSRAILDDLKRFGLLNEDKELDFNMATKYAPDKKELDKLAKINAKMGGYPEDMGLVCFDKEVNRC